MRNGNILERLDALAPIDWSDLEAARRTTRELLERIGEKENLRFLLDHMRADGRLFGMAEHFDRIDQLILYDDLSRGLRVRLHIYPQDHCDGPHNHRWPFTAYLLSGSYFHRIYRADAALDEGADMLGLEPVYIAHNRAGDCYTLHHSLIHSVNALPDTVSLIIRGPAEQERLMMTDTRTGKLHWKYGAEKEPDEEKAPRLVTPERYEQLRAHLERLSLI